MTPGGLTDAAGQLKMASDKLAEAWELTQPGWNDVVSKSFEQEQLQPLLAELRSTLDAISRIGTSFSVAVRECEDERSA